MPIIDTQTLHLIYITESEPSVRCGQRRVCCTSMYTSNEPAGTHAVNTRAYTVTYYTEERCRKVHTQFTKRGHTERASVNFIHASLSPRTFLTPPAERWTLNVRSRSDVGNHLCIFLKGERREANSVASPSSRSTHHEVMIGKSRSCFPD